MNKLTKTEAELIAMARAELRAHADCPDGITISVLQDGDSCSKVPRQSLDTVHRETAINSSIIVPPPTGNAMYCLPPAM